MSEGKGEHPAVAQLRADRRSLQTDAHSAVKSGRAAETQARASIGRVEHLMTASPLAEWGAKVDRLEGVIPLFRGENARLRGMDPASILAFAGKPSLSLPIVEAERGFPEPTDFARLKEEFATAPRLRGGGCANSDPPQRRELLMKWTRLALAIASFGLASSALGCGESAGARPAAPQTAQFIVGIDLSASRSVEALRDSRRLLDDLVESRLHNGDELVLLEMYGSSDTGDHQWIDSVPRARTPGVVSTADKRRLDDFKAVAHQVVGAMFDPNRVRRIDNTDVFATISRAADYAKGSHDRRSTLILLSDMENSTAEMRMERSGVMPSRNGSKSVAARTGSPTCAAFASSSPARRRRLSARRRSATSGFATSLPPGRRSRRRTIERSCPTRWSFAARRTSRLRSFARAHTRPSRLSADRPGYCRCSGNTASTLALQTPGCLGRCLHVFARDLRDARRGTRRGPSMRARHTRGLPFAD